MTSPGNFAVNAPQPTPSAPPVARPRSSTMEVLMPSGVEALEQMGLRAVLEDTPSHVQQEAGIYLNGRATKLADLLSDLPTA